MSSSEPLKKFPHVVKLFLESLADNDKINQIHHEGLVSKTNRTGSTSRSNIAGALQTPKNITVNSQQLTGAESCLIFSPGCRVICHQPLFRFRFENHLTLASISRVS